MNTCIGINTLGYPRLTLASRMSYLNCTSKPIPFNNYW